jgi:secondary thiamine-phosphate synthase enzyme
MNTISINSHSRSQLIDITYEVEKLIPVKFQNGLVNLFCMHTTGGLTVNENADPDVVLDICYLIDKTIPWNDPKYQHMEGNTAAHLKSSYFGPSLTLPIENGKLKLGTWQGIYFCEFDGPRSGRKVNITFISET